MSAWSDQDGVASVHQLIEAGLSYEHVRWQLRSGRWQSPMRGVVVLHSGPPTPRQRQWAAVLWAGEESALCAATAAELHGLRGYQDSRVHVCVPQHQRPRGSALVVVHRSANVLVDVLPNSRPRRVVADRALVELASGRAQADDAAAVLAAGVQQRVVTAEALAARVSALPRLRHRAVLLDALNDIDAGSESYGELLAIKLIRQWGLPEPRRQAQVVVNGEPRLIDLYWDDLDAGAEIVGGFHRDVETWWHDRWRNAQIQSTGTALIELPVRALRRRPDVAMGLLHDFLVSRGWRPGDAALPKQGLKPVLRPQDKSIVRRGYVEG